MHREISTVDDPFRSESPLGLYLLDYLAFDALTETCEAAGRWSFLCVVAPLRLRAGTGSPVNPIAIFLGPQPGNHPVRAMPSLVALMTMTPERALTTRLRVSKCWRTRK